MSAASLATAVILVAPCHVSGPSEQAPDIARTSSAGRSGTVRPATSAPRPLTTNRPAWVAVSVSTLWRSPKAPRQVDRSALASPVRIREWLAGMTLAQRRGLNGRADTQALLGDQVRVVGLRRRWAKVVVQNQPTPINARGYPGWVPRRQLTATPPAAATTRATVVSRLAWLRKDTAGGARLLRISFGTRLPVIGSTGTWVRVTTPRGAVRRVRASQVSVHAPGDPALPAKRAAIVGSATSFVGLDYLWAGRSGFGFDCSGLTSLVYRVHGLRIPRDASPQSRDGRAVSRLRKGDLMFYADAGGVHHVSMYAGNGRMVHSPRTGTPVQVIKVDTPAYAREYAGARRYRS